jgi:PIN domain nuclease of toxin-antitoxin system
MSAVLADTHAALWYLFNPSRLSAAADTALRQAEQMGEIFVSVVSVIEVVYLVDKTRLPPITLADLVSVLKDPTRPITALPVTLAIAEQTSQMPRSLIPDFPDRIIATTALVHGLPVVTSDAKIQAAPVPTIW